MDSLKDPSSGLNNGSEAVAQGYFNLANALNKQEKDLVKAERLIRESLRMRKKLYANDHQYVGTSCALLATIMKTQGKLNLEMRDLMEHSIAIEIKHHGADNHNVGTAYYNLGSFYFQFADAQQTPKVRKELLQLSIVKYKEVFRIYTMIFGPDHFETLEVLSMLSILERFLVKGTTGYGAFINDPNNR